MPLAFEQQPKESDKAFAVAPLLTRRELAAHLKVSVRTVDRLVAEGRIPVLRFRKAIRFSLAAVLAAPALRAPD